jgi:hypothetical protein
MKTKEETVTLDNIGGGAAAQLFEVEWKKVLKDIMDPNTDPKAERAITIKVTIKPDENRDLCVIGVSVKPKLSGTKAFLTTAFLGMENGRPEAREIENKQANLFDKNGNIASITGGTGQ